MAGPDVLAGFDQALAATGRIVTRIRPAQWQAATRARAGCPGSLAGRYETGVHRHD
jgi:hypothetical protein